MRTGNFIETKNQHSYLYSDVLRYFLFVPSGLKKVMTGISNEDYYIRKLNFLKQHRFFDKEEIIFQTNYSEEQILKNLACLRQLLIEVTDRCNLKCKYCGYGEFYSNYDQRETRNQTFGNVKILIDYLAKLWTSDYNVSYNNVVSIGFYGGEPLLNIKLIEETIAYIEGLQIGNLQFSYNMTTNAMLLDRYMDFLVEKKFNLLISLDGGEYQDSYRINKQGKTSFAKVVSNVEKLKQRYPDYFEKNVNFNSVLHDRNSVEECYRFIHDTFGKVPRTAELNINGIVPERLKEFASMFKSEMESAQEAIKDQEIKEALLLKDAGSIGYHVMLRKYIGNRFSTYCDMFDTGWSTKYIPTGTCRPFERKLYLTVHGKILPCEKMGHEHTIAKLEDGKLNIDCSFVSKYYSTLYKKVIQNCALCNLKKVCGQCMFLLKEKDGKLVCNGIQTDTKLQEDFSGFLTYAEENPEEYERLLSSIVVID